MFNFVPLKTSFNNIVIFRGTPCIFLKFEILHIIANKMDIPFSTSKPNSLEVINFFPEIFIRLMVQSMSLYIVYQFFTPCFGCNLIRLFE